MHILVHSWALLGAKLLWFWIDEKFLPVYLLVHRWGCKTVFCQFWVVPT